MSGYAIVDPRSETARDWPAIERALRVAYPGLRVVMTQAPGQATLLARRALGEGFSEIIAVGGDGMINDAVNGLFAPEGAVAPHAVFAFVSGGAGGDVRRTFGIPSDPISAVARLRSAPVRLIDVARLSCVGEAGEPVLRHFVNVGSFGLSGTIAASIGRAHLTKLFGNSVSSGLHGTLAMLAFRPPMVRLHIEGMLDEIARIATVAVANGQYFGGGLHVAPDAQPDDGLFDIVVMGGGPGHVHRRHGSGARLYRSRKLVAAPVIETRGRAVHIEVDGESAGRLPATFDILPRALNLRY
jgi:diacylglycerol kinase family enzyme